MYKKANGCILNAYCCVEKRRCMMQYHLHKVKYTHNSVNSTHKTKNLHIKMVTCEAEENEIGGRGIKIVIIF